MSFLLQLALDKALFGRLLEWSYTSDYTEPQHKQRK